MLKKIAFRGGKKGGHGGRLSGLTSALSHQSRAPGAKQNPGVNLLGAMLLLGPLSLLGEWLIVHTHHRPLGAAVFASAVIGGWILVEVTTRLLFLPSQLHPESSNKWRAGLWSIGLCSTVLAFVHVLV